MGAIIVMTLAISLIVTILTMYQGFMTTDPEKLRLMRSLGARRAPDAVAAGVSRPTALPSSTP